MDISAKGELARIKNDCIANKNVIFCYRTNKYRSSGRGAIPHRRYSPRPAKAADLVRFQNRQYSLDERRNCMTGVVDTGPGLF